MNRRQGQPGDQTAANGIDRRPVDQGTALVDAARPAGEGLSRRGLLAAAGGVALATSGLLLPARLVEEAAADEKPLRRTQGRTEQRNRKQRNRKRRNENARDNDGQDRGNAPGATSGFGIKFVSCTVGHNGGWWPEFQVDFYYRIKGSGDHWSGLVYARSAQGNLEEEAVYRPDRYSIAAYIHASNLERACFLEMRNPLIGYPWASISQGGRIQDGAYVGGTSLSKLGHCDDDGRCPFGENGPEDRITKTFGNATWPRGTGPVDIDIYRLRDTDNHKVFGISVYVG